MRTAATWRRRAYFMRTACLQRADFRSPAARLARGKPRRVRSDAGAQTRDCALAGTARQPARLRAWFEQPLGRSLQALEASHLRFLWPELYGTVAMQLGQIGQQDLLDANPSDGNKKTAAGGTGSRASRRRWAPARGAGARQFERLNRQVATHVAAGARQFERLTRQVATHVAAGARQFERLTRLQASRVAFLASAQSRLERPRATAQSRARSDSSSSKLRPG